MRRLKHVKTVELPYEPPIIVVPTTIEIEQGIPVELPKKVEVEKEDYDKPAGIKSSNL